ncbi:hypothetical protein NDU88_009594 [Pleurodeles waltl]|uniref:Uncharacterized protein n=1 Tax=Pleurodeles waltl TaxID=8319 RepID=A0AAV7QW84_PLEWA|nr:hypothetical protein NDU88_009594 [Pleurodeles waltl]
MHPPHQSKPGRNCPRTAPCRTPGGTATESSAATPRQTQPQSALGDTASSAADSADRRAGIGPKVAYNEWPQISPQGALIKKIGSTDASCCPLLQMPACSG